MMDLDTRAVLEERAREQLREVAAELNQLRLFIRHAARIDVATARGSPGAQATFVPPSR